MTTAMFTLKISEYSFILFFRVSVRLLRLVTFGWDMGEKLCCEDNMKKQF